VIRLDPAPGYHECGRCGVRGYSNSGGPPAAIYKLSLGEGGPRVYLCPDHLEELRRVLGAQVAA
jgi:hypothetical protein